MKLKIAVLAAVITLAGCQMPHGDIVSEHQVGQITFKGGSGLVYQRASNQVSRESLEYGERLVDERKANDPLQAAINKSVARGNEFEESRKGIAEAQNKCAFIVQAHEQILVSNVLKNANTANINALNNYREDGKLLAFNRCMQNANK